MTGKKLYLLLQGVFCVLLTVLFSLTAVSVLRSAALLTGPDRGIAVRQLSTERLARIMPLLVLFAVLQAFGLWRGFADREDKPCADAELIRFLAVCRVTAPSQAMLTERRLQKLFFLAGRVLFVLCMIPPALYLTDLSHFPESDPETMLSCLLSVLLPWTAGGLCALAASGILRERSFIREIKAAEACPKAETAVRPHPPQSARPGRVNVLRAALIVIAVLLILLGIINGSAMDVLIKAITLCTECVGLG